MSVEVVLAEGDRDFNKTLVQILDKDRNITLKGTSLTGLETISLVMRYRPKVLVLSTNLPDLDVVNIIHRIMRQFPTPILILHRQSDKDMVQQIRELDIGIIDYLSVLQRGSFYSINDISLSTRIQILSKLKVQRFGMQIRQGIKQTRSRKSSIIHNQEDKGTNSPTVLASKNISETRKVQSYSGKGRSSKIVIIGTSTGGPRLLSEVIPKLPKNMPPIVIIQHMPVGFIEAFSKRLNRRSPIKVKTATSGENILPGNVYLAPGGKHLEIHQAGKGIPKILLTDGPVVNYVKPAVDVTLKSATKTYRSGVISVILTGMGSDGLRGSKLVKKAGGKVLALAKEDADIYGMNRAVIEGGVTDEILTKKELVTGIIRAIEGRI